MATTEDILKAGEEETATYIDDNGEKKTGTVLKGYIDAAEGTDYYGAQSELYKGMLESQQQANRDAAAAAAEEARISAERQSEKVNTAYGQSDKELFRGYRKAVRDLPQQLAAMGATGGLSETSRVQLETGYGENFNKSQLQRMAELADLTAAAEAAKRQAAANEAQQNASALQNYYGMLGNLGTQKYNEDLAKLQQGAELKAAIGDFSGYVELGLMTEEEAAQALKAWIYEHPNMAARLGYVKQSSGGGGRRYYGPGETAEADWVAVANDALGAVNNGASKEEVISDIANLYSVGALGSSGAKAAIQYVENSGYANVNNPASN